MATHKRKDTDHKPVTLYVLKVDIEPSFEALLVERISSVDLEFNKEIAQVIMDGIQKQMDAPGTIRIRFTGRLVH